MPKKRWYRRGKRRQNRILPRTDSHPWTWPLQTTVKWTNDGYPLNSSTLCSTPITTTLKVSLTGTDSVTYGNNVPDWRKRVAMGISATSVLTGLKYYVRAPSGNASWRNTGYRCSRSVESYGNYNGVKLVFNDPGAGASSEAESQAKSRLLASVISARESWRGGNFLAEIGETLQLLRHPLEAFYHETWKFARSVKKIGKIYERVTPANRAQKAQMYAKRLGDAWLAYGFGVKPLLSDVDGLADALNRLRFKFDTVPIKGHGHSTVVNSVGYVSVKPNGWAGDDWSSWQTKKQDFDVRYKGTLRAELNDGSQLFRHFGLSFDDFVPAVWEAIPWSFFIDYFVNVQEMIDSMKISQASMGWLRRTVRNSGVVQLLPPIKTSSSPGYVTSISVGTAHSLVVRVNRVPVDELPYPNWTFKTPGWWSPKWINITALATQFWGSKPPTGRLAGR